MEQTKCQKCRSVTRTGLTYTEAFTTLITCALQLMTESVTDDASLQAIPAAYLAYANSVLWRYEILSGILAGIFLIKY